MPSAAEEPGVRLHRRLISFSGTEMDLSCAGKIPALSCQRKLSERQGLRGVPPFKVPGLSVIPGRFSPAAGVRPGSGSPRPASGRPGSRACDRAFSWKVLDKINLYIHLGEHLRQAETGSLGDSRGLPQIVSAHWKRSPGSTERRCRPRRQREEEIRGLRRL